MNSAGNGRTIPLAARATEDVGLVPIKRSYGEYPYVSADEIKKALKLKAAFSNMLDQMQ